jgi:hypothetical protein
MSSMKAPSPRSKIELLPGAAASDSGLVGEITHLVNRVYAVAEGGLWVEGATGTTTSEMAEAIAAWQVALAWRDGQIVGERARPAARPATRRVRHAGFRPRPSGRGHRPWTGDLGRAAQPEACLSVMQLELLVPREWTHPNKEFLHGWYTRIGYRPTRSTTIDGHPRLAPLLATPCDLVVYDKDLICHERTPAGR